MEENSFTRITIPASFKWQPGQHCFLRFPGFGIHALSSHPFTICSLPSASEDKQSEITFYIRHRGGFTARLFRYALAQPGVQIPVLVDGPYGGIDNHKFFESDRLIVLAGGSGAGWMLPFIEQFLRFHSLAASRQQTSQRPQDNKEAVLEEPHQQPLYGPKSLRIILATRDIATRTWFSTIINNLLAEYRPLDDPSSLSIDVHLTSDVQSTIHPSDTSPSDLERSSSSSLSEESTKHPSKSKSNPVDHESHGRPNLPGLIHEEAAHAKETEDNIGVFVCGPLTMQNDVRNAVAEENLRIVMGRGARRGGMYLHLEHFQWA